MITVEQLTFTYPKTSRPAVSAIDFHITEGEIFGFLGPSGAGKSTTQKILIGLLKDFQGQVSILGKDLRTWDSSFYEQVGVSFEFPNHFLKLTARENLKYFGALYSGVTHDPQTLLEWVGLQEDGDLLVSQYSKGMKNRLNLARALLHNPRLLFLDEPTTGLDPLNARLVKDLIHRQQQEGKTIFLTTHNMSVAEELCDRVAFIVDGKLVQTESPQTLKLNFGSPTVQVTYRNDKGTHSQEFPLQGLAENDDFLSLLRSGRVQTMHTQEATLENIFIQLTGRSLT